MLYIPNGICVCVFKSSSNTDLVYAQALALNIYRTVQPYTRFDFQRLNWDRRFKTRFLFFFYISYIDRNETLRYTSSN